MVCWRWFSGYCLSLFHHPPPHPPGPHSCWSAGMSSFTAPPSCKSYINTERRTKSEWVSERKCSIKINHFFSLSLTSSSSSFDNFTHINIKVGIMFTFNYIYIYGVSARGTGRAWSATVQAGIIDPSFPSSYFFFFHPSIYCVERHKSTRAFLPTIIVSSLDFMSSDSYEMHAISL